MKKSYIIPAMLIGILVTGGIAIAKPYGSGYGNNCKNKGQGMMTEQQHAQRVENRLARMDAILDLSDSQEQEIAVLFNQQWQKRQAVRDEMRAGRDERRAAMQKGTLDEATIRSNVAKRAEFQADRLVERAKMKQELYAILTPEQQEKAEKIRNTQGGAGKGQRGQGFRF